MGIVYKARDTKLDASPEELELFEHEARAISALNNPSIATIYGFDECGPQRFLALEYIAGGTLKSNLRQLKSEDRQLSMAEVVEYGVV